MCVSLGEWRMSHNAWASFYVIFCQKKVFMARRAGNSFNYAFNFFFCRTVLWLTLKLSTYFYSLWLHLYNPLLKKSWEFLHHIVFCAPAMFFCEPGSLIENIITFWLVPTVTTAILKCWVSSNVSRAGMEEILHFLFLILSKKLNWDIGSPVEEIKMCVTSRFFFSVKKIWRKLGRKYAAFPET